MIRLLVLALLVSLTLGLGENAQLAELVQNALKSQMSYDTGLCLPVCVTQARRGAFGEH